MTEPVKMTNEIEELEALLEKATPGPWWIDSHGGACITQNEEHIGNAIVFVTDPKQMERSRRQENGNLSAWPNDYDATLIVTARNLLPTLLQSLKDKDAEIERRILERLPMRLRVEVKHALDGTKPEILRND